MSKAMKYNDFVAKNGRTGRKLEQDADFEISSYHSITPQSCVNFAVQTDNIYDEDIISYAASGDAVAETSYVIFQVVKTENAYYADGRPGNCQDTVTEDWLCIGLGSGYVVAEGLLPRRTSGT